MSVTLAGETRLSDRKAGPVTKRLEGKVAIVTGAAGGIGSGFASGLAAHGARIVAADFDEAGAHALAEGLHREGYDCTSVKVDVTSEQSAQAMAAVAFDAYGRIDILVNVVGGSLGEDEFLDVDDHLWRRIVDVNLKTVHLCCQLVVPAMTRAGGGSLVHIATTNALLGCPGLATYSGVKAGLLGFSRVLATRFGPDGVRSNVVCPGIMGDGGPDQRQPLGRTATPLDIAHATLFLASDEAAFVTGQALAVDGAGGDPADALAVAVDNRVAVVGHADALVVEAEAHHHAFAFLLAGHVGIPPDEPRLVRLDVRTETAFRNAQITLAEFARTKSHFVTIKRQACLCAE